jgi:hypothetical protein
MLLTFKNNNPKHCWHNHFNLILCLYYKDKYSSRCKSEIKYLIRSTKQWYVNNELHKLLISCLILWNFLQRQKAGRWMSKIKYFTSFTNAKIHVDMLIETGNKFSICSCQFIHLCKNIHCFNAEVVNKQTSYWLFVFTYCLHLQKNLTKHRSCSRLWQPPQLPWYPFQSSV